ncbi:MAG: tRNA 2-thiouridine(34) synthase MnmA [Minisyncoccales bacterium]
MNNRFKKKVVVLMSGGLDSSVAAALLKKQGYEIVGAFINFGYSLINNNEKKIENICCSSEAEKRARQVAKILKIPFYLINLEKEFKKKVIDQFFFYLKKGWTPNPCVFCNEEIKFRFALEFFLKKGFDFVASGHYAKKEEKRENGKIFFSLKEGKDKKKDQSYFLYRLKTWQLKKIIFPLADLTRKEVEAMARKFKLEPVLKIRKSVDICFVNNDLFSFLRENLGERKGKILDKKGNLLGYHRGFWFYTLGQRQGLNLPQGPYFVFQKDFQRNLLFVTKNKRDLFFKKIFLERLNFFEKLKLPRVVFVKIRYSQKKGRARLFFKNKRYFLTFEKGVFAATPGQSAVFYFKDKVLGGGIISAVC